MSELYELPKGWEWKNITEITDLVTCGVAKKPDYVKEGFPFLSAKNVKEFKISLDDYQYVNEKDFLALTKHNKPLYGDILYSRVGSFGEAALIDFHMDFAVYVSLTLIKVSEDKLNNKYMVYLLNSPYIRNLAKNSTTGIGVQNLNVGAVRQFMLPTPPLEEQKRIVAKLDILFAKIDKVIALHQKNIDEADIFMASVLNDVFAELEEKYQFEKLGSLSNTTSGGTPKRNEKTYWNGDIGWLKSGELNDGNITEVEEFITEIGLNKSSAKLFAKGTLLIAMYGATVGKLGILEIETTTNQAICGILNDKNKFEIKYMFYFLKKNREKMIQDSFGGAQPNISQAYIRELEVPLPPLETQKKVVNYLDKISSKIEKIKELQKSKMQSLKELKASILDKAFKGEL